ANKILMQEITKIGKGIYASQDDYKKLIDELISQPEEEFFIKSYPLWSNTWTISIIMIVLTIIWILKKLSGNI
ncbi:MAG TPA: hypothetical protein P5270_07965, partial [Victivallales bacterium]|nr:hypothetical protein [Victivallales bacterium]HRR29284.1 hypothetical protein [Victivallales bacterium]